MIQPVRDEKRGDRVIRRPDTSDHDLMNQRTEWRIVRFRGTEYRIAFLLKPFFQHPDLRALAASVDALKNDQRSSVHSVPFSVFPLFSAGSRPNTLIAEASRAASVSLSAPSLTRHFQFPPVVEG